MAVKYRSFTFALGEPSMSVYDVLVIIDGNSLHEVASFVAEKLATIQGVISTTTHFLLKRYKENGVMIGAAEEVERLAVSP